MADAIVVADQSFLATTMISLSMGRQL